VLRQLKNAGGFTSVSDGDLGENISVDDVTFQFFQVGKRYQFGKQGVLIQITERIEPCGNLCKLPYFNSDKEATPMERLENCKNFLLFLNQKDGLRGWYGKIIGNGGEVQVGDRVTAVMTA